jgi:ATP-dependent Lon protease
LFINLNTGKIGEVGTRDVVVFDEIANTDFTDPRSFVSIMQGYMQDAKFSRGKKELLAFASLVFVGNIDVQGNLPHEKYYHLFEPLPDFLQVTAFLDRLHAYLPGWEIPKLGPESYSQDYGFITDYFCEILHELRRVDILGTVRSRFVIVDTAGTDQGISGRDQRAIMKTTSALLKLLYPDGQVLDEELEEVLLLSCELRQRVREQLHLMAQGEYERVKLGVKILSSGKVLAPNLPDAERIQRILLPVEPRVGEVLGLAVAGDHGCTLHFEMQASKGHGRIVPLGSIQKIMRESIEAAAQYIKTHHDELGIGAQWRENYDVEVLATYMGVPKEGPSAGVAMVVGIVSALKGVPVRNDLAMTGEITIMGKVLPVGGIQQKIRAAYDAGIKEVLLPADNLRETENLPAYVLKSLKITPIISIAEALDKALTKFDITAIF